MHAQEALRELDLSAGPWRFSVAAKKQLVARFAPESVLDANENALVPERPAAKIILDGLPLRAT